MLNELCDATRNYFEKSIYRGSVSISNGIITPSDFLQDGQYFRIVGSLFNDGVHQYPNGALTDEVFDGEVWAMRVPPAFIALAEKIKTYADSEMAKPSPYTSESFGGYSYTKAGGDPNANSWQSVFRKELNRCRKV